MKAIFVTGMARSGTTIMAHVLLSHPEITAYVSGSENWLLENDLMCSSRGIEHREEVLKQIKEINNTGYYALFKRPWIHKHYKELKEYFPDAYYIIMNRNCKDILDSWKRFGGGHEKLNEEDYNIHQEYYKNFVKELGKDRCKVVQLEKFKESPTGALVSISRMLNIPYAYDISEVSENGHWDVNTFIRLYGEE